MEEKLLYELEYQVNELRNSKLSAIKYENLTIKELLDLGFDNCFIRLNNNGNEQWFNLGYKWKVKDNKTDKYVYGYESNDFGELNEKQLNCMVEYVNDDLGDYNYLQVSVDLVNEEDNKYFIESECD